MVTPGRFHGTHEIKKHFDVPIDIWHEVPSQREIEREIIARNRRHLQQIEQEQGVTQPPLMRETHSNYEINPSTKVILARTYEITYEVSEEQAAWLCTVKQTGQEKSAPKVLGSMDMGQFQETFKLAQERRLSLPAGLHYTIWKAMVECNYLVGFQCVMLSVPFIYGFFL